MEWKALTGEGKKQVISTLNRLEKKGRAFGGVVRALWKTGVPTRFWLFLFVVGVILGVWAKAWAFEHILIGYDDYRLLPERTVYDLNAAQLRVVESGGSLTEPQPSNTYPTDKIDTNSGL